MQLTNYTLSPKIDQINTYKSIGIKNPIKNLLISINLESSHFFQTILTVT